MTYGLPPWMLAILLLLFVLGPLLAGIGAILTARNSGKVDKVIYLQNGQTERRIADAHARGRLEGKAETPPVVMVAPVAPVVLHSEGSGSDTRTTEV